MAYILIASSMSGSFHSLFYFVDLLCLPQDLLFFTQRPHPSPLNLTLINSLWSLTAGSLSKREGLEESVEHFLRGSKKCLDYQANGAKRLLNFLQWVKTAWSQDD
jgi:hypothetical protein